jgi:hypothetical protein
MMILLQLNNEVESTAPHTLLTKKRKKKQKNLFFKIDGSIRGLSCLLTSSLSLGISSLFCRATQCM